MKANPRIIMAEFRVISLHEVRKDMELTDGDVNNNVNTVNRNAEIELVEEDPEIAREELTDINEYVRNRRSRLQRHRHRAFRQPTSGNGIFQINMVIQLTEVFPSLRTLEGHFNERRRLQNRVGGLTAGLWRKFAFGGASSGVNLQPRAVIGVGKAFNPEEVGLVNDNGLFNAVLRCGICGANQAIGEAMIHFLNHGRDHQILVGYTGEMYRREHCQLSMKLEESEQRVNYILDYRFLMSGYYKYNWDMACLFDTMMTHAPKAWMDTLREWLIETHIHHYRYSLANGVM